MKGKTYRKDGGKVEEGVKVSDTAKGADYYAGGDSNVAKEAAERTSQFKKGGKVSAFGRGKMSEGMDKFEAMKAKKAKKDGGKCDGMSSAHRLDRAKRASGGPLSTASKTSERPNFKGMKDIND